MKTIKQNAGVWVAVSLFLSNGLAAETASSIRSAFDNVVGMQSSATVFSGGHVGAYPDGGGEIPRTDSMTMTRSVAGAYVFDLYDPDFVTLGEWISPPAGLVIEASHPPRIDNEQLVRYVESRGSVLALAQGTLVIEWWNPALEDYVEHFYIISQLPPRNQEPVHIWHTEGSRHGPLIDLSSLPTGIEAQVYPNKLIQTNNLWLEDGRLRATGRTGFAVLLFSDEQTGEIVDREVVDVRSYVPTVAQAHVEVGTWLEPYRIHPNRHAYSYVANGKEGDYPYVYQHETVTDTNYYGRILTVAQSGASTNIEVFWMRTGHYDVKWPYEMRRYTTEWPVEGTVAIYETDRSGLQRAPTIASPSGYEVFIHANRQMQTALYVHQDGHFHADLSGTAESEGMVVLHYEDGGNHFSGREIVEIWPYVPDYTRAVRIGSRLEPVRTKTNCSSRHHIAAGKMDSKNDHEHYIWQHVDSGNRGPYDGAMFATKENVDPINMEVFWLNQGLHSVAWPFEMDRYSAHWPGHAQTYVRRSDHTLPHVRIPEELNVHKMPAEQYGAASHHGYLTDDIFYTDGPGYSLLSYETGAADSREWVGCQVIRSVWHDNTDFFNLTPTNWAIGREITNEPHQGIASGYIYELPNDHMDDRYHPGIYGETSALGWSTGQVFAVNTGSLEVWWSQVTHTNQSVGIQWPASVHIYNNHWPTDSEEVVIASQFGTGPLSEEIYPNWDLYIQNDPDQPGFNPNDEHALIRLSNGGTRRAIFALRDDLGSPETSEPFVLMSYDDPDRPGRNRIKVYRVLMTNDQYTFSYPGTAGHKIQPPYPVTTLTLCPENQGVSGPYWRDRKTEFWAKAAGDDGGTENIVMQFYYPNIASFDFYFPSTYPAPAENASVAWLDIASGTPGTPIDIAYAIHWPSNIPTLRLGETLAKAKNGLPDLYNWISGELLYQQSEALQQGSSVRLVDPFVLRTVSLDALPDDIETTSRNGIIRFTQLPPHLRQRLSYDPINKKLDFLGKLIEPAIGEYYLLPNVITDREKEVLLSLSRNSGFQQKVETLAAACSSMEEIIPNTPFERLALTAGEADAIGYLTLVENNSTNLNQVSDPIALHVLKVEAPLYRGEIKVVDSDNLLDEKLVLRHSGDMAGHADQYVFEWRTLPPENGAPPSDDNEHWPIFETGSGIVDITIEPGKVSAMLLMSDNYFITRYKSTHPSHPLYNQWSEWTEPQLAEGWVKRVMNRINPFEQRFNDYATHEVNTIGSMIEQAGKRYLGAVALNSEAIDEVGLIEFYTTILDRGRSLSIDGNPSINYAPANDALLLAAGRLADLHMLLGNEAYADAADPTIGFGTDDGTYGDQATSLHCFMNQTASLLEEELKLLRGRDDRLLPSVEMGPIYNRLLWNYSNDPDGGEVAYSLHYQVTDRNTDGFIDEADAKIMYPQGHGDAWGHYLTAGKGYYHLLRNPHFTWEPRMEAMLIGGAPVNVDYMDERQFARIAAAKAKTGSEIVNLTYRDRFEQDVAGQWQGYKDTDTNRAWGVSEWNMRCGLGAYYDWVVGNSLLPAASTNVGIQKIDRTTVSELDDIASSCRAMQRQMDEADIGLNPLGLARNVVPFDISPAEIDKGHTHFEQIYQRAVQLMNNTIAVFNDAQNSSQLLRRQADRLDEFQQRVEDREVDFNNRLIELFGYPYAADIGPGKTYETGYDGADIYHYMYVDPSEFAEENYTALETIVTVRVARVESDGTLEYDEKPIPFHFSEQGFGLVKPPSWTGSSRRAPGELQMARSDLIQARIRFEGLLTTYNNLLDQIEDQAELLEAQHGLNRKEIRILNREKKTQKTLNRKIAHSRELQQNFRAKARLAEIIGNALAEALPSNFGVIAGLAGGTIMDWTSFIRSGIRLINSGMVEKFVRKADKKALAELSHQQTKEMVQARNQIKLTTLRGEFAIQQKLMEIEQLVREETVLRLGLFTEAEAMNQLGGKYLALLSRGERLLVERERFRKQTAAEIQEYRYKDMAFRIFRNEALQKYRAQFDLAARYVYLTAKAYDYETNLGKQDGRSVLLDDILQARSIGKIENGIPLTGGYDAGLADPMARMNANWSPGLDGQLGFDNPETETQRFSLRHELFRIASGYRGNARWHETLERHVVDNLLDLPEFHRYCIPFSPAEAIEPAIVIPFSTVIDFGYNFFGWPSVGGDNAYDSTHFSTKTRSAGVWFANYNTLEETGLGNTPRVYLIPVGNDVMRIPDGSGNTREWAIVDQAIPIPYGSSTHDGDTSWMPADGLVGTFAQIRRFSSIRAYHDSGGFSESEVTQSHRLIGRSVWNTRWLLIIPAGSLHSDREDAIRTFIDGPVINQQTGQRSGYGVQDIKIFFQTYSYSGEMQQ